MTREMHKPDLEQKKNHLLMAKMYHNWQEDLKEAKNVMKEPVLDETWKPFIDSVNQRFKQCG